MNRELGLIGRFEAVASVGTRECRVLSVNTKKNYVFWLRKFWEFVRRPGSQWTPGDVSAFIHWMAREGYGRVSRKQALCAIVYVFKNVLKADLGRLDLPALPPEKKVLKIIPTRSELVTLFHNMTGMARIMAGVMYGAGLRVMECCTLRMKDVDVGALTIRVHAGKGDKDRLALLPRALVPAIERQMNWRAALHERDLAEGAGYVDLPGRLRFKYRSAPRDLAWQFLFPSTAIRDGHRWHAVPEGVQKAISRAKRRAGILKRITPHTLRHAFCTHGMRAGNDPATMQDLMGHQSLETTMIYAHGDAARGVSPMDAPDLEPRPFAGGGFLVV